VANFTAVYDACVLYPASVRDLIIELARTGLFRAKRTFRIHTEWINAAIRHRPELERARPERVAELMNSGVPDCLVTGDQSERTRSFLLPAYWQLRTVVAHR
jgi:hypothetical protein